MSDEWLNLMVNQKCSNMPWYKAKANRFLFAFLPNKIRRLIFLASIFGYIRDNNPVSDETVYKINKVLQLSNDDQAIKLPIVMKDVIWKNLNNSVLDDKGKAVANFKQYVLSLSDTSNIDNVVSTLIKKAPCWALYGDINGITKDIKKLLTSMAHNDNRFTIMGQ